MPITNNNQPTFTSEPLARPTSPPHAFHVDDDASGDLGDNNNEFPQAEQILVSHLRFAHALRKNDAAMILQYLSKDVTLISMDGAVHEGQSAVLAYLVGPRMTKVSANLHIKGCPSRSGVCQSTFIYEHGIVFKDPLFMEVLEWKPQNATIIRITHFALPNAKSGKTPHDFSRSMPLRLSFGNRISDGDPSEVNEDSDGNETGESENYRNSVSGPVKMRSRRLKSNSSADTNNSNITADTTSLRRSSSSGSNRSGGNEAAIQPLTFGSMSSSGIRKSVPMLTLVEISCKGLVPIRKRKTVNPFVLMRCPVTNCVWKSPIMRRDPNPKWTHLRFKVPIQNIADVVEISLWDHTFFRSVKVAGAALVLSDVLKNSSEFCTTICLERFDATRCAGEPQHVSMQLRFVQTGGSDSVVRSSNEPDQNTNKYENKPSQSKLTIPSGSTFRLKSLVLFPFVNGHDTSILAMVVLAAIVAAVFWMLIQWP
ncbi:putative C2 domain-containing protein [Plasmopara halstedii]